MSHILIRTLVLILLFTISLNAQIKTFETDILTIKKPWTHLKFYNNPENFQFAIVSDNTGGSRKGIFEKAVGKLNLLMPEFVMSVGDLIPGYTEDTAQINYEWNQFNKVLNELKPPYFYLPGNHDITNLVMQKEWEKRYGKRYYHFVYKNTLFITLDSNDDDDYSITNEQMDYVLKSLKDNPDVNWTFLFMHHPIWTYDTDNRFEAIEAELSKRKYTVFAGHKHRYNHIERNEHNYYILGTTGGGSALRGHRFGEFDHLSWVTLTDDGPVFANLELDGIHDHDISNEETQLMAKSLLRNTTFEHVLLTNSEQKFSNGTLYLYFENSTDFDLNLDLQFYHHHELRIDNSEIGFNLLAKSDSTLEISLTSGEELDYENIGVLQFDWALSYMEEDYSDFYLEGKYDLQLNPIVETAYVEPNILQFIDTTSVKFNIPFKSLIPRFTLDRLGTPPSYSNYVSPILIKDSEEVKFKLLNNKNQSASLLSRSYQKLELIKALNISNLSKGLSYKYFEGIWRNLPNFDSLDYLKFGTVNNFLISDIADRKDNFGIVYNGFIEIPKDSMYIFRMKADDASKLFIHHEMLINDEQGDDFGAIFLQKGFHPIKIEYMEQKGNERLRMYYKNNENDEWIFMPFEMFYKQ
jgi:PA14 domain/Calcineurin-like phosphoesterase